MKYIPRLEDNKWTTTTANNNGNGGIHCQEAFKDGVLMLEACIANYSQPRLIHTVLCEATLNDYKLFITQLKRAMTRAGLSFEYKACHELDSHKGQHAHVMWVVDTDDTDAIFNMADADSMASVVQARMRRHEPSFDVYVGKPENHHPHSFIPLDDTTLQDAGCYVSYLYKRRSKPKAHRYMSSRSKVASDSKSSIG